MDGVFSHEIPKMKAMLFCLWPFEVHFLGLFFRGRISSVGRALDRRAGDRRFDSRDRTNTQGLKND